MSANRSVLVELIDLARREPQQCEHRTLPQSRLAPRGHDAARGRRRPVSLGGALDKVWDFVRTHEGFRTDGHNVFIYRQKDFDSADGKLTIDFGVQITRSFAGGGDVICSRRRRVTSPPRCM